jgi:hypothetical protein
MPTCSSLRATATATSHTHGETKFLMLIDHPAQQLPMNALLATGIFT